MAGLDDRSAGVSPLLLAHGAAPSDACISAPPAAAPRRALAAVTPTLTVDVTDVTGAVVGRAVDFGGTVDGVIAPNRQLLFDFAECVAEILLRNVEDWSVVIQALSFLAELLNCLL